MSNFSDFKQDSKISALETEANGTLELLQTMSNQMHTEKKRNDVQTARIKTLSEVLERTLVHLTNLNAIQKSESDELLTALRAAMAP